MKLDRDQLALECRGIAEDILAFVAQRPDAPGADEAPQAHTARAADEARRFEDDFSIEFGERLQHVLIRLTVVGFGTDQLDPLTYGGISRLGARHAAETLQAISLELLCQRGE